MFSYRICFMKINVFYILSFQLVEAFFTILANHILLNYWLDSIKISVLRHITKMGIKKSSILKMLRTWISHNNNAKKFLKGAQHCNLKKIDFLHVSKETYFRNIA